MQFKTEKTGFEKAYMKFLGKYKENVHICMDLSVQKLLKPYLSINCDNGHGQCKTCGDELLGTTIHLHRRFSHCYACGHKLYVKNHTCRECFVSICDNCTCDRRDNPRCPECFGINIDCYKNNNKKNDSY